MSKTLVARISGSLMLLLGCWIAYTQNQVKQPPPLTLNKVKDDLYEIVGDGGSRYIRSRVFLPALETERQMWTSGATTRATISRDNYTFADSLILVSILLLGGIGNPWGLIVATIIVVVVPEKLQTIQEYRFLLYALLVIMVLLFRPEGLLPRPVRRYFPGWRP